MNIAIYSRKSKFVENSKSTENQISLCKDYCEKHFEATINYFIYEDEGFSGKNDNRPAFKKMTTELVEKNINCVVCYKLDRISRNVTDFNNIIKKLDYLSISFISIKEQFDTTTPMGRAMMLISAVFAQLERETIGERIKDNLQELSINGSFVNSKEPFGYNKVSKTYIDKNNKQKTSYALETNQTHKDIVLLIFSLYEKFESINKVKIYLNTNNIKTKNGFDFRHESVKRVLSNPFYCCADENSYNYFSVNENNVFNSELWTGEFGVYPYRKNSNGKTLFTVGTHNFFISSTNWILIQKRLEINKTNKKHSTDRTLLSDLIYCPCGEKMRSCSFNKDRFYYVCKNKEKTKGILCSQKNIRGDIFEKKFIAKLISDNKIHANIDSDIDTKNIIHEKNKLLELKNIELNNLIESITSTSDKELIKKISSEISILNTNISLLTKEVKSLKTNLKDGSFDNTTLKARLKKEVEHVSFNNESVIIKYKSKEHL